MEKVKLDYQKLVLEPDFNIDKLLQEYIKFSKKSKKYKKNLNKSKKIIQFYLNSCKISILSVKSDGNLPSFVFTLMSAPFPTRHLTISNAASFMQA